MKHLKAKLMTSIVMLLIAAIAMSTASYAWFTISTNPEIKDIQATVVVNENLEIAYRNSATAPGAPATGDTTKAATYGNLIDKTTTTGDAYKDDFAAVNKTLRPATLKEDGKFYTVSYGVDGRPDALNVALTESDTTGTGFGNLVDGSGKIYGYYLKLWVRTNVAGNLQISAAAKRSTAGTDGTGSNFTAGGETPTAADKVLAKNFAVAYKLGTGAGATITKLADDGDTMTGAVKTFTENTTLGALTANNDTELTLYFYLEGATVTNASASIAGTTLTGTLNLQFKNSAITTGSMDGQN